MLIVTMFVALSGCTSSSVQVRYDNYNVSFNYPDSWSVAEERIIEGSGTIFIRLETEDSRTLIWVYQLDESPVKYETFPITKTVGDVTYKKRPADLETSLVSYVIRKNGKDFFMMGTVSDGDGHEMILESATF